MLPLWKSPLPEAIALQLKRCFSWRGVAHPSLGYFSLRPCEFLCLCRSASTLLWHKSRAPGASEAKSPRRRNPQGADFWARQWSAPALSGWSCRGFLTASNSTLCWGPAGLCISSWLVVVFGHTQLDTIPPWLLDAAHCTRAGRGLCCDKRPYSETWPKLGCCPGWEVSPLHEHVRSRQKQEQDLPEYLQLNSGLSLVSAALWSIKDN